MPCLLVDDRPEDVSRISIDHECTQREARRISHAV
jgi:hypothetical protein